MAPQAEETPTVLGKDEQLLCDLPLEATVARGLRAGGRSRLLRGAQCVVRVVDDLRSCHSRPGAVDVREFDESAGLDGLRGFLHIELQTQISWLGGVLLIPTQGRKGVT